MPGKDRRHYKGSYSVRAEQVRAAAYLDPGTRCWRSDCRLTLAEAKVAYHERVEWTAGHVVDSDPHSPLRAECSHCNFKHGQALGAARRKSSGGTGRI